MPCDRWKNRVTLGEEKIQKIPHHQRLTSGSSRPAWQSVMPRLLRLLLALAAALLVPTDEAQARPTGTVAPVLPTQFRADVVMTSHLTEPAQSYPPSVRELAVQYDFEQRVARAEVRRGHDQGKVFVRRYDTRREYMAKRGAYRACERAYLGDEMPRPEIPFPQRFVGVESVRSVACEHWIHSYANVRVHVYSDVANGTVIRLTEENLVDNIPMLLLTYDLLNVQLGPQNVSQFDIPDGFAHDDCTRSMTGFPYIHAFHYYLRF